MTRGKGTVSLLQLRKPSFDEHPGWAAVLPTVL